MNKLRLFLRSVNNGIQSSPHVGSCAAGQQYRRYSDETKVPFRKCLILTKMTRYEYERIRHKRVSESELQAIIRKRGTDYEDMLEYHRNQRAFEESVASTLRSMGMDVKLVNRLTFNSELIEWCDVVVPCGGDGTFLFAASKVTDTKKPVVGFNSDPKRSVGRLCLPRWCTNDLRGAVQMLKEGRFRWMHRTRIRTTLKCDANIQPVATVTPVDLHTPQLSRYAAGCHSYEPAEQVAQREEHRRQIGSTASAVTSPQGRPTKVVIPYLALNEVFIGENVSARVSHLQLTVDNGVRAPTTRTKSSGLCVTTGTGSTSWHLSINCLRTQSVQDLLRLVASRLGPVDSSPESARRITELYNQQLVFAADSPRLAYSVRELIAEEDWPAPKGLRARDFATSVHVKSACVDAGLVIDGGVSFPFNDGTEAILEILPEDALRTVIMEDI